jgi:hypothetical protein
MSQRIASAALFYVRARICAELRGLEEEVPELEWRAMNLFFPESGYIAAESVHAAELLARTVCIAVRLPSYGPITSIQARRLHQRAGGFFGQWCAERGIDPDRVAVETNRVTERVRLERRQERKRGDTWKTN